MMSENLDAIFISNTKRIFSSEPKVENQKNYLIRTWPQPRYGQATKASSMIFMKVIGS